MILYPFPLVGLALLYRRVTLARVAVAS